MDSESRVRSRRAFIRASGAWVAVSSLPAFAAAGEAAAEEVTDSALVCVYLMIGGTGAQLASGQRLNPVLTEVQSLYEAGVAAIVGKVGAPAGWSSAADARYSAARFSPGGSMTPRWASPESTHITVLPSGVTLASTATADSGALASAAAAASFRTVFPDNAAGRQLRDAAAVLRLRKSFGLARPVFTAVISGFRLGQSAGNDRILTEVSAAVSAFYQSTVEMNMAKTVTLFTDMDFGPDSGEGRAQLVVGGAVGGGLFSNTQYGAGLRRTSYDEYTEALQQWAASAAPGSGASGFLR